MQSPSSGRCGNLTLEILLKRLLEIIGERLCIICSGLNLDHDLLEYIWKLIKRVLIEETQLIENLHIDLLIVCSIYASCAKNKINHKRFMEILSE